MSTIDIADIGPVKHLSLEVPPEGGLVVLRGRNGGGKSLSLEAVESAITGRGKPSVRDGALRGSVEAFGAKIVVGKTARRSGELEVSTLEGRLSVAELVDPGLKTPEAADAKRIKALISLAGVTVEEIQPAFVEALFDGDREAFESIVPPSSRETDDPVLLAERIKRDIETAARRAEAAAETESGRARGLRDSTRDINVADNPPADELNRTQEEAIRVHAELVERERAANEAGAKVSDARAKLDRTEAEYKGPTSAAAMDLEVAADAEAAAASEAFDAALALHRAAEERLHEKQRAFTAAKAEQKRATDNRKAAERHELLVRQYREQLAGSVPPAPPKNEVLNAHSAVLRARQAVERGVLVRNAVQSLAEADEHARAADGHTKRADRLRNAAGSIDDVLSTFVGRAGGKLRVEGGRLVLDTARGATFFSDLSHGQKWKLALDIGIDSVGEKGVLVIPQTAFEGLDPENRRMVAEHVRGRFVTVLTAACSDDDEIRAEVYGQNDG